jgi:hypothetical protein
MAQAVQVAEVICQCDRRGKLTTLAHDAADKLATEFVVLGGIEVELGID